MVALRGKEIDAFLARPDSGRPIILLYGPDAGLVRERADALIASAVDDPNDPFSLVRLDGDELSAEPSRLVDEAMTIPMFGGRRAIRVRAGSRSFASGVDTLADLPIKDCRIVIEAGELRPESPLRKACERAKTAVAIACYPDTERDLARLIDEELRTSNLRIAADARAVLMSLLGGDRQASRNELRKLALYAHGKGEIALDDVMTVVSDASELKLDPIVDGAFAGKPELVESEFAKAMVAGTYPGVIISAAQRQAAWLHKSALAVAEGTPVSTLLESGYPRLHFSRKGAVEIALRNFSAARLATIIDQLGTAALDMRKQAYAGVGDRAAHAAVDRGECEAAGVSMLHVSRTRGASGCLQRMRPLSPGPSSGLHRRWTRQAYEPCAPLRRGAQIDPGRQARFARRACNRASNAMYCKTSAALRQPPHHLVELFEVAVADLDGAAGVAVADGHGKTERIADALFQRDRVGIF